MQNKKISISIISIILIIIAILVGVYFLINKNNSQETSETETISQNVEEKENKENGNNEETQEATDGKVDIVDTTSKIRPYAISINNTPVAVKVQTGLNKAYMVYEIPTEGNTSRLLAFYQNLGEDVAIGTIRSARHNFIDYALESNAVFVHYGWSHYAEDDEKKGVINYINGLFDKPFWRNNPEGLASEHTAYTSLKKIEETVKAKKFDTEADDTILLNYNTDDVDLSSKEDAKTANKVTIPYGSEPNITAFEYDAENKTYNRLENGKNCIDYETKENVSTKNIIVQKVNYTKCSDGYYWDLDTIGQGKGYFITNGYAVPITWKKDSRAGKTKYFYENGGEIRVSDGRTYIEVQTNNEKLSIE